MILITCTYDINDVKFPKFITHTFAESTACKSARLREYLCIIIMEYLNELS